MGVLPEPKTRLEGWKAIADYLKRSEKTAQNWERDFGLPIHRREGGRRVPVHALTWELDAWLNRSASAITEEPAILTAEVSTGPLLEVKETNPEISTPRDRRWWLLYAVGAGLAAAGASRFWPKYVPPVDYRIAGRKLAALDESGQTLWEHTFGEMLRPNGSTGQYTIRFADVDGDGKLETLFIFNSEGVDAKLICLDSHGDVMWQFIPGHQILDNQSHSFAPPYGIGDFKVVASGNSKDAHIVVSSFHHWSFPCQVALLNARSGTVASEYWHRGHLLHIGVYDIDGDGRPEVLLGGVNDAPEYKQATLLIFDQNRIGGCNRNPDGQPYFQNMGHGTQKVTLFFPRTAISRTQEFNRVRRIDVAAGRITVEVVEGVAEWMPEYIVYEFDSTLRALNVGLSDEFQNKYMASSDASNTPKESFASVAVRLKNEIRVLRS